MSYFGFLAVFIVFPIGLLWLYLRRSAPGAARLPWWAIGLLAAVAVIYTTPWDNYLVATRVWWYDPELVTGIVLGWVPIEEYTFFVLQPVLAGLWVRVLLRAGPPRAAGVRVSRAAAAGLAGLAWAAGAWMLLSGGPEWTYLGLELAWALPPVIFQLAYGADILARYPRLVLLGIGVPTLYLSAADALAIGWGTWTIDPAQSTGLLVGGVLPVEEFVFFLLTSTLLVFGYVLILAPESRERLRPLLDRFGRRRREISA